MRDLVSAKVKMFSASVNTKAADTQDTSIRTGRSRLRSVYVIDTSHASAVGSVGLNSYVRFKDGDNTGNVLLQVFPDLTGIYLGIFTSHGVFLEFPGNGMLFPDGIHAEVVFDATGGNNGVRGLATTVVYA